jgi:hypothetical protein
MKYAIALLFSLIISNAAMAGDHWDNCSSADGSVRLIDGVLTVAGVEGIEEAQAISYSGTPKVLKKVKTEKTTCVLKDSGKKATVMENVITVEEITYALEEDGPASKIKAVVVCERGAGNLVPEEFCKQ